MRGDADDVFSHGFICPKAYGIKQLHEDPDRLTTPLVRRDGELVEASWDEAFEEIDRRLAPLIAEHGKNAVAVYLGNPNAHNLSALIHGPAWLRVLGLAERVLGVDGRPDAEADVRRTDVRRDAVGPDPGRGPLRPPAAARREPARVERQPAHRARHARAPARHPRARRQGRGGGPAPHAHRRGGGRAPLHPARHRRAAACRDGLHDRRGGARRAGRARRAPERARRAAHTRARLHARGRGRRVRDRRRGDPPHGARAGGGRPRGACTRASAPARRSSARTRAGSWTCSTRSPATSTARAARCSRARRPGRRTRPGAAPGAACASAAGAAACAACRSSSASCRCRLSPRRSTRPARARCAR